jgi:hypothetical protein
MDYGPCEIIFVCVVVTVAMVWRSFPVKGFCASCDNIATCIVMLFDEA